MSWVDGPPALAASLNHGMQPIFKNLTATFSYRRVPQAVRGNGCHLKISFLFLLLSFGGNEGRKHLSGGVPTAECSLYALPDAREREGFAGPASPKRVGDG